MKKLLLLTTLVLMGIFFLQAQELVPEKPSPNFGPFDDGSTPEVVMKFKNTDTKPVKITEYYPIWEREAHYKSLKKNGPQPVITIAPGQDWILKFRIPTSKFKLGKNLVHYKINSNAIRLEPEVPFSFEVQRPPSEEGEGPKGPSGGRG